MKTDIGGKRLGSGNRMEVNLRNYERSSHNLDYVWRNTQSPGTLVPFMSLVGLPGDTFDIDIASHILTHPTVGPLFGSYKFQADIFVVPIRLYHKDLHNNKLEIGNNMSQIKLPVVKGGFTGEYEFTPPVLPTDFAYQSIEEEVSISSSSLFAYLGKRHWGKAIVHAGQESLSNPVLVNWVVEDSFNAVPILGYYDIFKNYYANKQEKYAYHISGLPNAGSFLEAFELSNIDKIRELIYLNSLDTGEPFIINQPLYPKPYYQLIERMRFPQGGLCVKTYQSDLFNNYMNTEWLDGGLGINEITTIDTSEGLTMDTLAITKKIYDMLNRIAISGGSYEDWLEAVYTHDYITRAEIPIYQGGMSTEIVFQEVVSQSATEEQPLGTLGGRGTQIGDKGGLVRVKIDEPSYIIGICSITPRIDYSQGNTWDTYALKNMSNLHVPALDGIGFQELITQQMIGDDYFIDSEDNKVTMNSIGKQPAWINYMTNYNQTYGNFAEGENEAFMVLNRGFNRALGLSTYIDPRAFNGAFAQTDINAMNFWVQLGMKIVARRKISAKIIPNL